MGQTLARWLFQRRAMTTGVPQPAGRWCWAMRFHLSEQPEGVNQSERHLPALRACVPACCIAVALYLRTLYLCT